MDDVLVTSDPLASNDPNAVDTSAVCQPRERPRCIEILRQHACELGSRRVLIRSEGMNSFDRVGVGGGRRGVTWLVTAWIVRDSGR
jgi:hypothetical protein